MGASMRKGILVLTDRQLREVQAAAALLGIECRTRFLCDLASYLAPLKRSPTNADVAAAIKQVTAITPVDLGDMTTGTPVNPRGVTNETTSP